MKKLIFVLLVLLTAYASGQKRMIDISKFKIGNATCTYSLATDTEKGDSLFYVMFLFQDSRYEVITSIADVMISKQEVLKKFIEQLKSALPEINQKGNNVTWEGKGYTLVKWDWKKELMLTDSQGGYTPFSFKEVQKLIAWLERIEIGNMAIASEVRTEN